MKLASWSVGIYFVAGATSLDAVAGCENPRVLYPAAGEIIANGRPLIQWSLVTGAKRYRMLVRSQVPNGPVILEIDNWVTDTQFIPARPLASERANVTVRIVPDCSDDVAVARLRGDEHRFAVDPMSSCPAPLDLKSAQNALGWRPSAGARSYEVTIFATTPPKELLRAESTSTAFSLPVALPPGAVAAVRARCPSGSSSPVFTLLQ